MWDYSFEVPVLMIMGIILIFFFLRPRLPIRRNRVFLAIILIETFTILSDVSATLTDIHHESYGIWFIKILNALYFIFFFFRAYIMYLFAPSVTKDLLEKNVILRQLIRLPMYFGVIMALHSMFFGSAASTHFIFYVDEAGYHQGGMYNYLYFCGFYYIFLAFVSIFLFKKSLGRRREKYGILVYNLFLCAALVLRVALPNFLIMDTFIFMSILVIFLAFGNPEYFLDLKGITFNAYALREYMEEDLEKTTKVKNTPLGVVIHNYRDMRDLYGYSQMEEGLGLIARYLSQLFPKGQIFYYRNGRFVVLVPEGTDLSPEQAKISERFDHPWKGKRSELYLSVATVTFEVLHKECPLDIIFSTMIKALDTAGGTGKDLRVLETEISITEQEKAVRASIEAALGGEGFELFLQPIVEAGTGKIIGAEALSRIRDREGNLIPPGVFIPIAENSGRINELGELVFEKTCAFIKENDIDKYGIEWINVNLSPAQFVRTDLAQRYSAIVEKYGIDPGTVHLEITEGSMIDDSFLLKQMRTMNAKGFKFVLDDYGTGYSNLARLKTCPFINVKLDMSIVWDYCKEPDGILPVMVQAFKQMGFCVTAEGVEDEAMASTMNSIGCDFLQGYHYSKPLPGKEFSEKYTSA